MEILDYLNIAVEQRASDIFLAAGAPVSVKKDGGLVALSEGKLFPGDTETLMKQIYAMADRDMAHYMELGDDDFSFSVAGLARFRVSAYRQRTSMAAVIRVVAFSIPGWDALGIPQAVMDLAGVASGLLLFTGTAGSGKSTTQACLIDRINRTRACHIITLEDPIEYLHRNNLSIVSQREIAIDTRDYLSGLRACLRQAPDVILLGEMRDPETIRTAMTAAETGHTVIATLHTKGTANSIDRIIDSFPAAQQEQIRVQLSNVLQTVVSQQLLPDKNGGLVPAFEMMKKNNAICNLIREGKTHQIATSIAAAGTEGMWTMDQAIAELYKQGKITMETAMEYCDNPAMLKRRLGL